MQFIALFDAMRRRAVCNSNLEFRVDIRLFDHPTIWTATTQPPPRWVHGQDAVIIVSPALWRVVWNWGVQGWNFALLQKP